MSHTESTPLFINHGHDVDEINAVDRRKQFMRIIRCEFIPTLYTFPRSVALVMAIVSMTLAGGGYAYGLFGPQLREIMDFSILEVALIGTAQNQGFYLAAPVALINDIYGPRVAHLIAVVCHSIGYGLLYVSMRFFPGRVPSPVIALLFYIIGTAFCCQYNATIGAMVKSFSARWRGLIVGIMASCFGISAFLLSFLFKFLFNSEMLNFVLFLAILMPIICFLGAIFVNSVPPAEGTAPEESQNQHSPDDTIPSVFPQVDEEISPVQSQKLAAVESSSQNMPATKELPPQYRLYVDHSPLKVLATLDFWLAAVMMFTAIGGGLMVMNNVGDIVDSRMDKHADPGAAKSITANLVSIISIGNCSGRLLVGFLSDVTKYQLSRPFWFMLATGLMGVAQLAFAFSPVEYLYFVCAYFSLCYGSLFSLGPTFISERFGTSFFTTNFALLTVTGPAFGSVLIASLLASWSYNMAAHGKKTCHGVICFQRAFLITTIMCLVGACAGFILLLRNRFRYQYLNEPRQKRKSLLEGAVKRVKLLLNKGEQSDTYDEVK